MKLALALLALALALAVGCTAPKPVAASSSGEKSLAATIGQANTNAAAALASANQLAADAAASVAAVRTVNTSQPPGPGTDFIDAESELALAKLPAPDSAASLAVELRRAAIFAGQRDEARRLYAAAQGEAATAKADAEAAKARAAESAAALVAAERNLAAQLERNRVENQAKLDAALKAAADAEDKARAESHRKIFAALLGLGLACLAGAIALAVLTSGAMVMKSLILAGGGALCIAIAQIVAHPWFDRVFVGGLALAALGAVAWLLYERKQAVAAEAQERTVLTLEQQGAVAKPDGTLTDLGLALSRNLDGPHKAAVRATRAKLERTLLPADKPNRSLRKAVNAA